MLLISLKVVNPVHFNSEEFIKGLEELYKETVVTSVEFDEEELDYYYEEYERITERDLKNDL